MRPTPQQIKDAIRSSIKDGAAAEAIISRLNDDELARGELRITEDMLNTDLRASVLGAVPNNMLKDYSVTLRDGVMSVSIVADAMVKLKATYGVRFTGFSFSPQKGHRIKGTYTEKIGGVPRLLYAKHGSMLNMLLASKLPSGVSLTGDSFDIRLDEIPDVARQLTSQPQAANLTLRMGKIADGSLLLCFC